MTVDIQDSGHNNQVNIHSSKRDGALLVKLLGNENLLTIEEGAIFQNVEIRIFGDGNVIHIGKRTSLRQKHSSRPSIEIRGDGHTIALGKECGFSGRLTAFGTGGSILLGAGTTCLGARIATREGNTISIGDDGMFSGSIWISDSDMHPIYDRASGKRVNSGADIVIGSHVWLGMGVKVLKGVRIGKGCMVGAHSMVTRDIPDHCLAQGVPAAITRENIYWKRELVDSDETLSAHASGSVNLNLEPDSGK